MNTYTCTHARTHTDHAEYFPVEASSPQTDTFLMVLFMLRMPSHDHSLLTKIVQHHCRDAATAANNLALLNS